MARWSSTGARHSGCCDWEGGAWWADGDYGAATMTGFYPPNLPIPPTYYTTGTFVNPNGLRRRQHSQFASYSYHPGGVNADSPMARCTLSRVRSAHGTHWPSRDSRRPRTQLHDPGGYHAGRLAGALHVQRRRGDQLRRLLIENRGRAGAVFPSRLGSPRHDMTPTERGRDASSMVPAARVLSGSSGGRMGGLRVLFQSNEKRYRADLGQAKSDLAAGRLVAARAALPTWR